MLNTEFLADLGDDFVALKGEGVKLILKAVWQGEASASGGSRISTHFLKFTIQDNFPFQLRIMIGRFNCKILRFK